MLKTGERSAVAFESDLPELLLRYAGKWVAYHGKRRLGIFDTKSKAVRLFLEQGIPEPEIFIRRIEEQFAQTI